MVAHIIPRNHAKRQIPDPPTIVGISGSVTVDSGQATTQTALLVDGSVTGAQATTAPQLASTHTPTLTFKSTSPLASATGGSDSFASSADAASGASSHISMSTVIGTCVGAFFGAVVLILLSLWFYRRYSRSLKAMKGSRSLGPASNLGDNRNVRGEADRSQPWDKLEEGADKWEGMDQTKEVDILGPMEKLTMFKKSPSTRTADTHISGEPTSYDDHSTYHANPTRVLEQTGTPRSFLGRVDTGATISWDSETGGDDSFLSIRSTRMTGGAMSPTLNMAIPTPPATHSPLHRWESAEIIHYSEPQTAEIANHDNDRHDRDSGQQNPANPFFGAEERPESPSWTALEKGKGRAIDVDPFSDGNIPPFLPFAHHTATNSTSSISSNDRALQSLIAALDISEEEVQDRLRVASMQPSVMSSASAYTDGGEDVTQEFPRPPALAEENHAGKP